MSDQLTTPPPSNIWQGVILSVLSSTDVSTPRVEVFSVCRQHEQKYLKKSLKIIKKEASQFPCIWLELSLLSLSLKALSVSMEEKSRVYLIVLSAKLYVSVSLLCINLCIFYIMQ